LIVHKVQNRREYYWKGACRLEISFTLLVLYN